MKTMRLMTCESSVEADIIRGKLESEGIPCFITNRNMSDMLPNYYKLMGSGAQIIINAEDYDNAVEILGLNQKFELKCPECGSSNIESGLGSNKFKKIVTILLSIFTFVPIGNINPNYKCRDCGKEFK